MNITALLVALFALIIFLFIFYSSNNLFIFYSSNKIKNKALRIIVKLLGIVAGIIIIALTTNIYTSDLVLMYDVVADATYYYIWLLILAVVVILIKNATGAKKQST